MSTMSLRADVGREIGSRAAGRLRAAGKVPAVVYGHGTDTRSIAVDHRELDLALSTEAGRNAIFELDLDGTVETAVAHQIDRHPTKNRILHVDFVLVDLDQVIDADINVRVEGEGPGVKEGGIVELIRPTVHVRGVVSKLPNEIVVDASELEVGDTIHISQLPEVEGIEYLEDDELTVLTVTITRAAAMGEEAFEAELAAASGAEPTEPGTVGEEDAEAEEPAEGDEG
ncbi:MAG: 50S ribosomal protein L25 [Acidimicrobiia bacterium]